MSPCRALLLALVVLAPSLRADVTARYEMRFKLRAAVSAGETAPAASGAPLVATTIRMKGNKGLITAPGASMVIDFVKREITVLDAEHRKYATVPASEYSAKTAETLAMTGMSFKFTSRITGRTEKILGIQCEEREVTGKVSMQDGGPGAKMVVHIWAAMPKELLRVPGAREFAGITEWQRYFMNPFPASGGTPNGIGAFAQELEKDHALMLRMETETYMPSIPAGGPESDVPFMQFTYEVTELSPATLDAALFEVPAEYTAATLEQMREYERAAIKRAMKKDEAPAQPLPDSIRAYVPNLSPVCQSDPVFPETARAQNIQGVVELLVTLDAKGGVTDAEPLNGPAILRQAAVDAVKKWKFRPVLRDGQAVAAYTTANVYFIDHEHEFKPALDIEGKMAAMERLNRLAESLPRTPQQVLADLEQDNTGRDGNSRFHALAELAYAALKAGADEKAAAYANELLAAAKDHKDWSNGDAIHNGNEVLGLLAVRRGDLVKGREHLLESAKSEGSPVLGSFGPDMTLAKELLEKGERAAVLEYFDLCRNFWKMGKDRLDSWSESVRNGGTPNFIMNLRHQN